MNKYSMLIGGEWMPAVSGEYFESVNPFTGAPWALIPRAAKVDVEKAVSAAHCAFHGDWRKLTATARGAMLRKLADLIAEDAERLAQIETTDNGKLIAEMRAQLRYIPQ